MGIVAGKAKFMDGIDGGYWAYGDQSRPKATVTFFAGPFCTHPITAAACYGALKSMGEQGKQPQAHGNLQTARMCTALNEWLRAVGAPLRLACGGSPFKFHFAGSAMGLLWTHLLNRGVYTWEGPRRMCASAMFRSTSLLFPAPFLLLPGHLQCNCTPPPRPFV